jgi:hypothetical protein
VSPRITILTGRFGSGKTEIALNYALLLAGAGLAPLLVDLDIVTPYFRTRDKVQEMARGGVEVVAPLEVGHQMDVPAISPRIRGAIEQSARPVVIDLGGDRQGARAAAQYALTLERVGYAMDFCVNPFRPFMDTVEGICAAVREIESSSRLHVSALISNPNLMSSSTLHLFWEGHGLVEQAGRALGLPVAFAVMSEALFDRASAGDSRMGKSRLDQLVADERLYGGMEHQRLNVLVLHRFFLMFDQV